MPTSTAFVYALAAIVVVINIWLLARFVLGTAHGRQALFSAEDDEQRNRVTPVERYRVPGDFGDADEDLTGR